jgi:hypothetical protein
MRTTSRGIGFPATGTPSAFQPEPPVLLRPPSSSSFDAPSSSRELSASCRVLRQPICPSCLNLILRSNRTTDERLPWGLRPSSRHQPAASTIRQESRSHRHVPSSAFLTPSTVCSATSLCGLVSSRCHVQGLPYRELSLTAEPYGVSPAESCPRVVERTRLRFDPRQQMRPRLQGLAPRAECGADRGCLDPDRSAPLMGFMLLRVLPPCNVATPSGRLRPRRSLRRTPRSSSPAFRRCTDWLSWNQVADPLELSCLNPRPPFGNRVRGFRIRTAHRAAGHAEP